MPTYPVPGAVLAAATVRRVSAPPKPPKTQYTCNACGASSPKWLGKCPGCGEWNTLEETVAEVSGAARHRYQSLAKTAPVVTLSEVAASDVERTPTGQPELDRVLGGGIVEGGVVLIGGDPGIGKSTLLLQAAETVSTMCSSTRGPASAPSLVTWPTSTMAQPLDLAVRVSWAAHSRTCATEPGAEVSWSEYTV